MDPLSSSIGAVQRHQLTPVFSMWPWSIGSEFKFTDSLGLPAPDFEGSVRLLPQPVTHASLCRATGCRKPSFAGMLVRLYSSC